MSDMEKPAGLRPAGLGKSDIGPSALPDPIASINEAPRREIAVSAWCDRTSRRCMLTLTQGDGGYADLENASPREIVDRIRQLQADPSLIVRAIAPTDLHAIVRPLAIKAGVTASPFEAAADDDAAWFRRNPRAKHRTRALFPGEMGPHHDGSPHVLVTQIRPGLRMRQFGYCRDVVQ